MVFIVKVVVWFLLWLREKLGVDKLSIDVDDGASIYDVLLEVCRYVRGLERYVNGLFTEQSRISVLVNGRSVSNRSYIVRDGDIIELTPLVSGG